MNKIFKVIKCQSTGEFKAVPEFAKSAGKGKGLGKKLISASLVAAIGMVGAQATGNTVGGGQGNEALADFSTVSGGIDNKIDANAVYSVISGGINNKTALYSSTVGGGQNNDALGASSTVAGGSEN